VVRVNPADIVLEDIPFALAPEVAQHPDNF
jgi:hypothetical protein